MENQLCVSFVCWISNASLNTAPCPLAFWSHSRLPLNPLQHEYSCTHHNVDDESSQGWLFSKASWWNGNKGESLQLLKIIHLWESQQSHSQKSQIHRRAVKRPWNMATKNASQLVCVFFMCISRAWSSFVTSCWDPHRLLSRGPLGGGMGALSLVILIYKRVFEVSTGGSITLCNSSDNERVLVEYSQNIFHPPSTVFIAITQNNERMRLHQVSSIFCWQNLNEGCEVTFNNMVAK